MKKQEKIGIWKKIQMLIKNIFKKSDRLLIEATENNSIKPNLIEELAKEKQVLIMQGQYEKGNLNDEELSLEELDNLIDLYKQQIETLETSIDMKKRELMSYKEKILSIKNSNN